MALRCFLLHMPWQSARVAGRYIEKQLGTPSLVRETSKTAAHHTAWKSLGRLLGYYKVWGLGSEGLRERGGVWAGV